MDRSKLENYFLDFFNYLEKEKNLSKNSLRAYRADIREFLKFWEIFEKSLGKIVPMEIVVKKYRANFAKKGTKKTTIARKLSCLSTLENFLNGLGIKIDLKIVRPHVPLISPKHLSIKEINFLLDEVELNEFLTHRPMRDKAILELLYATGMRASELIAIRMKDFSIENKSIAVRGKRRADREVFFSERTKRKLLNYLEHERGKVKSPNEFLFLNYREEPLTTRSLQRICNQFSDFLKKKHPVTPQILRHSFAAHMIEQGADLEDLKKLLGFRSSLSIEKYLK